MTSHAPRPAGGVGWALTHAAARWPEREALVFEGRRYTFTELWRWTTAVALQLRAAGVGPGTTIVWQLPNLPEALVVHFAGWRIGATCVPVIPIYREHELRHILGDSRPDVVVTADRLGERDPQRELDELLDELAIEPMLRLTVGDRRRDGWASPVPLPAAEAVLDDRDLPDPGGPDDACLVLYTSGTTAAPKGVVLPVRALDVEARTYLDCYGFNEQDTLLMAAPIGHITGLLTTAVIPATCGARTVLLPKWDAALAVAAATAERATFSNGATPFLRAFVEAYEDDPSLGHRISRFQCGGAAVPAELVERADAVGINVQRAYGMTELPTVTLTKPSEPLERRARTDGRLAPGVEAQAIDDDRRPLRPGEVGELRVRGPEQMLRYTDATATAAAVDADGWFHTGDVGLVEADGWVTITGRLKDIINRGGEKFAASDIEQVIATHPAIAAVAVIGAPEDRLGEEVVACVTVRDGRTWPGATALQSHLEAARLARPKIPRAWFVLDELPATPSGKVQKHVLLQRWHERGATDGERAARISR